MVVATTLTGVTFSNGRAVLCGHASTVLGRPWTVQEIAGLPGGATLAELVMQVEGSPAAAYDLADRWTSAATGAAASTTAVEMAVTTVGDTWQCTSYTAFADHMQTFAHLTDSAQLSLGNGGAMLYQVARAFEQAQFSIDTICEDLLFEVSQLQVAYPQALAAELDGQISYLVSAATYQARAVITSFEAALTQAQTAFHTEFHRLSHAPAALRDSSGPTEGVSQHVYYAVRPEPSTVAMPISAPGPPPEVSVAMPRVASGAPAQVDNWISQAIEILAASGIPASQLNPQDLWLIIEHESSGNPFAVNNWDYNAAAGTPSIGLMQTIAPTFNAYALPGHNDITNPIDNIIAGTRYALARYGSLDNVPGVIAVHNRQAYVGY